MAENSTVQAKLCHCLGERVGVDAPGTDAFGQDIVLPDGLVNMFLDRSTQVEQHRSSGVCRQILELSNRLRMHLNRCGDSINSFSGNFPFVLTGR